MPFPFRNLLFYYFKIVWGYFCGDNQKVEEDYYKFAPSLFCYFYEIAFDFVKRSAVYSHFLTFGDVEQTCSVVDFVWLVEVYFLLSLLADCYEVVHLFGWYGEVGKIA